MAAYPRRASSLLHSIHISSIFEQAMHITELYVAQVVSCTTVLLNPMQYMQKLNLITCRTGRSRHKRCPREPRTCLNSPHGRHLERYGCLPEYLDGKPMQFD